MRSFFGALLALGISWHTPARAVDVVVGAALAEDAASRSLVRGLFGMRARVWPDGTPVHVFVLADDARLHEDFCTTVLQMYPYQLRENWDRLLYSGTGQPPTVVQSEEEMLRRVAETPGAIGYVSRYQPPAAPAPAKGKKSKPQPPAPRAPVKVLHVQ